MKPEMPKAYESGQYEDAVYAAWEKSGFFNPDHLPGSRPEAFTIVLPPPNVTGTLHMGHAVMLAIEDIMVRFARMRGKRALWIPGTDHAAIATQTKVEKLLMADGMKDPRRELGREKFLAEVNAFAMRSHDTIVNQVRRMGASIDWSREAYTLDEARNKAVNAVFKMMYDDGLIYRGNRVINWCPRCKSTLADDEVEHKETNAKLYTFAYDAAFPITIATTRPETKLGDTAVAVHPSDERYAALVGKTFEASFAGKKLSIKIVADEGIDSAFGTGALGVTPSHSNIDAEIARKNNLPSITVIGEDGCMTAEAGSFAGKTAKETRTEIVAWLREQGLLQKEEDIVQNLSVCYRCGTAVEPLPKLQWFISVTKPFAFRASTHAPINGLKDGQEVTLKSLMQHVVREGEIKILPERFDKTYFSWINNLRDWNISRQIWFGHRVPVWYQGEEIVVGEAPVGEGWIQDEDTLDTWFSSGLWTISTLGWPNSNSTDLPRYHPTSVLETGYDIIFFWVARMILMTTYAVGEVPFKTVYLHGLVRDEQGRKMSKSLDNIIDPLDMIGKYGADATRLSLVIGSTPGNDMKLSEEKIAGYRNFTNKLWNIARFVLGSVEGTVGPVGLVGPVGVTLADKWILSRLSDVTARVTKHLEAHELSAAGELLRDFTWSEFADWYLEIAKVQKGSGDKLQPARLNDFSRSGGVTGTDGILLYVLERLLVLWHPFMPFVTEVIWKDWKGEGIEPLIVAEWPKEFGARDEVAEKEFALVQEIVTTIRNVRAEHRVKPALQITAALLDEKHGFLKDVSTAGAIAHLARLAAISEKPLVESGIQIVTAQVGDVTLQVETPGNPEDKAADQARLQKELEETRTYVASVDAKLANQEFTAKAPAKVVDGMKAKRDEAAAKAKAIEEQLKGL